MDGDVIMDQHPAVIEWARKKFGITDPDIKIRVVEKEISGGYCDTCYYEYTEWHVIQYMPDGTTNVLHRFDDDLASMLREILEAP